MKYPGLEVNLMAACMSRMYVMPSHKVLSDVDFVLPAPFSRPAGYAAFEHLLPPVCLSAVTYKNICGPMWRRFVPHGLVRMLGHTLARQCFISTRCSVFRGLFLDDSSRRLSLASMKHGRIRGGGHGQCAVIGCDV